MKPNYRRGWLVVVLLLFVFAIMWLTADGKKTTKSSASSRFSTFLHLHTQHLTVGQVNATPTATPFPPPPIPKGVFYLPSGQTWNDAVAGQATVVGAVIGAPWGTINPTENTFDFTLAHVGATLLASMLAKAEALPNIKAIRIGISCGGAGDDPCHGGHCTVNPGSKPQWLEDKVVSKGHTILYFLDG